MHVVIHRVDTVKVAVQALVDAPDVAKEFLPPGFPQNRGTLLGGEHDVIQDLRVGVGHGECDGWGGDLCHRYAVPPFWQRWVAGPPWVGTHGYRYASTTRFRAMRPEGWPYRVGGYPMRIWTTKTPGGKKKPCPTPLILPKLNGMM